MQVGTTEINYTGGVYLKIMDLNNFEFIENFTRIKQLCTAIVLDAKNMELISHLQCLIAESPSNFIKNIQSIILPVFYKIIKLNWENKAQ